MAADQKLQQIVERMVTAGESEADIASVIQHYKAQAPPPEPPKDGKSVSGFLGNVGKSTVNLIKDSATGAWDLAKFAADVMPNSSLDRKAARGQQVMDTVRNAPQIAKAAGGALKDRYGSLHAIGNTVYTDPAGVAADLSTVLTGGAAAAARAPRLAGTLGKVAKATNPLRAATAPAGGALKGAGNLTVRATLRPSKAIREDFGGSKGVADAVLKERVYSEGSAQKKLAGSVKDADDLLAAKEAAGVRGVPAKDVADSLTGAPSESAGRRAKLGVANAPQAIADRRQHILDANAIPGHPNATRHIPLTEAQALKREAQDMAYEARRANLSMDAQADSAVARSLREGIERRVPEVGPINERSQRLIGTQRAFADAQDRPRALTNLLSLLGATGGFAGGGTPGALLTSGAMKFADSPRLGALAGIALNEAGDIMTNPKLLQAALLARLAGQEEEY